MFLSASSNQPTLNSGTEDIRRSVYGCDGGERTLWTEPVSAIIPLYITAMLSAKAETVDKSWLIKKKKYTQKI